MPGIGMGPRRKRRTSACLGTVGILKCVDHVESMGAVLVSHSFRYACSDLDVIPIS